MSETNARKQSGNPAWIKGGPSPNPGGRPAIIGELRDLAREHTVEAVETLVSVIRDPAAPHAARVTAAREILDRGFGRPSQEVAVQAELNGAVAVEARPLDPVEAARAVAFALALAQHSPPVREPSLGLRFGKTGPAS